MAADGQTDAAEWDEWRAKLLDGLPAMYTLPEGPAWAWERNGGSPHRIEKGTTFGTPLSPLKFFTFGDGEESDDGR